MNSTSGSSQRSEGGLMPQLDLLALLRICYRQWPILLGAVCLTLALGTLYLATAPRQYTATFRIMVDTRKNDMLSNQDSAGDRQLDPGLVESQVEILKSNSVAEAVVRDLKLASDPEFMGSPGLLSRLMSFGSTATQSQEGREEAAVNRLTSRINVKRIGVTYVIEVDYTGTNPQKAATIASALADAYMVGELDARFQATKRASQWLEDRISELRDQSNTADLAVQKFKSDNNIVDTSRGLMSEQQLADVNAQLVTARASTAEAKARYDRVQEVLNNSDIVNGTVADALRSEVISRLRAQYLDLSARQANLAERYGNNHGAVVDLRRQMTEIERTAREELQRVAQSARSEFEISQAREASLSASLDALVTQAGSSNEAQVQLRDLESTAQSYRSLYDSFLQKFQEATQEQTFPVINARVITPATPPSKPSGPKSTLVYAGSVMLGLVLGFAGALGRELLGNKFRTPDDVNNYAGLECLGVLPMVSEKSKVSRALRRSMPADNVLGGTRPISRQVIMAPFSRFTETVRNVKVSVDIARVGSTSSVIAITSSIPAEGKTTFSSNLALLTAQMGHKTLLIDGDMHSPSLTKTLLPNQKIGLIELLQGKAPLADVLRNDVSTGLDFIPTVVGERQTNIVSLLTSPQMRDFLEAARERYEYIYIDMPPVVPVVDVKASTALFDSYVFVIEWAATSRDVVRDAMLSVEAVRQRFIGAILNKADPAELKRLEAYRGSAYGNYYIESDGA